MNYRQYVDRMESAYLDAADWTDLDEIGEDCTGWAREAFTTAREACQDFLGAVEDQLDMGHDDIVAAGWGPEQAGHDLWLTRNGHGTGFWDRGYGNVGDRFANIARTMGGQDVYVGDDGMAYLG